MDFFERINFTKVLKIAIGSGVAILIAEFLGLKYVSSAGIITLLSIQDTKKSTIKIALKRIAGFAVSIFIAFAAFNTIGYNVPAFICYLLVFVAICIAFGLYESLSPCAVLVTHIMSEKYMNIDIVRNEAALMLTGTSLGILLNMYMPRNLKHIREYQARIDDEIKIILDRLVKFLNGSEAKLEYDFDSLEKIIDDAVAKSYTDKDNILSYDLKYFINYMEMRKSQIMVLRYIFIQGSAMNSRPAQAYDIADFLQNMIPKLHESNNAVNALIDLYFVKEKHKSSELPKTGTEFEDRATLRSVLVNIEQFLEIKREFAENISDEEKKMFWK